MARRLLYAIGDIHGRLDLLQRMVSQVVQHLRSDDYTLTRIVFLGDYIDKGPNSRGVVEALMKADRNSGVVCLKGNHEAMLVQAFRTRKRGDVDRWRHNGGDATLRSYGAERLDAEALDLIPQAHIDWLDALPVWNEDERRTYVHAGLAPGVALQDQDEEVMLWIRERFLRARDHAFNGAKHVVHGHTPEWKSKPDPSEPELLAHRTNLDTGAYATGVLTVGVFDRDRPGGPIELLRVSEQR